MARIGALQHDHARVVAQRPGKLAVTDIDRVDPRGAVLEQDVGEAAGRRPDVDRDRPGRVDGEMRQRVRELDAAARNPGVVEPADFERDVVADRMAGLVEAAIARPDAAGEDERLRARARFDEPARNQRGIQALPGRLAACGLLDRDGSPQLLAGVTPLRRNQSCIRCQPSRAASGR